MSYPYVTAHTAAIAARLEWSNVPGMPKLANGSRVRRADLTGKFGYVVADTGDDYVTWRVEYGEDTGTWHAYNGHYFGRHLLRAYADYDDRRAVVITGYPSKRG